NEGHTADWPNRFQPFAASGVGDAFRERGGIALHEANPGTNHQAADWRHLEHQIPLVQALPPLLRRFSVEGGGGILAVFHEGGLFREAVVAIVSVEMSPVGQL